MGAYIFYKLVDPKQSIKANTWSNQQKEQKKLNKYGHGLWFWDKRDREIELEKIKNKGYGAPDFMKIGEGQVKTSGLTVEEHEKLLPLIAKLFQKLHEHFKIKIYSKSCSLSLDYFTVKELKMITKNGNALSGDSKQKILDLLKTGAMIK